MILQFDNITRISFMIASAISLFFLLTLVNQPPQAFDSYWHARMGLDLINEGLSPFKDHYSFTHYGEEIAPSPFIFQFVFGLLINLLGDEWARIALKLSYVLLVISLFVIYLKKANTHSVFVLLLLPLLAYFVSFRLLVRPELVSNILLILVLLVCVDISKRFSKNSLIVLLCILIFWCNYHTPLLGYVVSFGAFADYFWNNWKSFDRKAWSRFFFWCSLILVSGFMNYNGSHFLFEMLTFMESDFKKYIGEFESGVFAYRQNELVFFLWISTAILAVINTLRGSLGSAFVLVLLLITSLSLSRMMIPLAIVALAQASLILSKDNLQQLLDSISSIIKFSLMFLLAFIFLVLIFNLSRVVSTYQETKSHGFTNINARFPAGATTFLKEHGNGGRVLNGIGVGGYLLYHLAPNYKVYIDGRTNILYPIDFVKTSVTMYAKETVAQIVSELDIDYVVSENRPHAFFQIAQQRELVYADDNFLVFGKQKIYDDYPIMLNVLPMCVATIPTLEDSRSKYRSSGDLNQEFLTPDTRIRVKAYKEFKANRFKQSLSSFSSIQQQNIYDVTMISILESYNGNKETVEAIVQLIHSQLATGEYFNSEVLAISMAMKSASVSQLNENPFESLCLKLRRKK